jgi:hypothetical protein
MEKKCSKCKIIKSFNLFHKNSLEKSGRQAYCKKCVYENLKQKSRTKKGLLFAIYFTQVSSSKYRGHDLPKYSKECLVNWALSQDKFYDLYNEWVISGYPKEKTPSVDRLDDSKGYSFDNIQIVDWKTNRQKFCDNVKKGIDTRMCKTVNQYTIEGKFIKQFYSLRQAERETKINNSHISAVCRGVQKTAGGFIWKYF